MAEGREYISHESELGSVSISEEVLAVIAARSEEHTSELQSP